MTFALIDAEKAEYPITTLCRTLGVSPILGRDFAPEDDREGAAPTIVISHEVWTNDFGGSLDVVGRAVRINGRPGTVIGVMPPGFAFPLNEQVWAPMLAEFPPRARDERQGVGPANGEALGVRQRAHQSLSPARSATVCMSLSPRPDRFTSSSLSLGSVGASLQA